MHLNFDLTKTWLLLFFKGDASGTLNPHNNMPAEAAQASAPGQAVDLDKTRVKSTIPKGDGTDENWEYPSPQMVC
jgi:hypothetical protein